MIVIIDYGMGNLRSIQKALEYLSIKSVISAEAQKITSSGGIILPGVGAFPDAMENMEERGMNKLIKAAVSEGKPILGICLGMQLLFEESEEVRKCSGIGLLKGKIKKLESHVKIPHMGWNRLLFEKDSALLKGVKEGNYVYFVHSYYAAPGEEEITNAYSIYGKKIPAVVSKGNIYGTQFHPEKSGEDGLKILKNFGELVNQ